MYKSFYKQVTMRVYQSVFQALEALQPYFKESEGVQASVAAFYKICRQSFFSYESFNARKKKNLVPTSYLQEE